MHLKWSQNYERTLIKDKRIRNYEKRTGKIENESNRSSGNVNYSYVFKNSMGRLNSRLDTLEERIRESRKYI